MSDIKEGDRVHVEFDGQVVSATGDMVRVEAGDPYECWAWLGFMTNSEVLIFASNLRVLRIGGGE